jgi:lipopolysaccharide transport system ATP-binding protein
LSDSDTIVSVEGVSKRYLVGHRAAPREKYTALRDVIGREAGKMARRTLDLFRGRQMVDGDDVEEFWALKDVSFKVKRGEVLGIIGRNGAGKSTLLKILSRITEPTEGCVRIKGRVASLLEVGTGFHPELTGRENIYLNGAILGMTRGEIRRKFDEIVAFAEVEKFLDTPVKRYSSGMYVRLAFAVAAHLEPEILAVDEVLAVGDVAFQKKCLGKMGDVVREGRTVLFVSHNMNAIEKLCQRVMYLERGTLAGSFSDVREGVTAYLKGDDPNRNSNAWHNSRGEFKNGHFEPDWCTIASAGPGARDGEPFSNDHPFVFTAAGQMRTIDPAFNVGIAVYSEDGSLLFWTFIRDIAEAEWQTLELGFVKFRLRFPARWLNEGAYRVELLAGLHFREWFMSPGVNAPTIEFSIRGGLSDSPYWNAKRPGLLAPALSWDIRQQDAAG